ncbi:MAG: cyclodeaminase/cyclohydrolase family protein [Halolamina sp.]|uniref:cyclodeaminase/cyclohydrolase family protein n=1 Tax=Halolamina sp. TaxID=1940283 RepID=UPI002FC3BA54
MNPKTPTIDEFLARIASENVSPAGGTASAVVGAIGTSLCEMVCIHTVENDEYADVAADVADLRDELRRQRAHLLDLAEADATVVDELFSTTAGEMGQQDIKRSIGIPLTVAVACGTVLDLAVEVTAKGNRNALGDAGTGVFLAHAALRAAIFTVGINTEYLTDQSFVNEVERRTAEIELQADDAHEQVMHQIEERV